MPFHPADFELPGPVRSRVMSRHATDRQTDGQTDTTLHFIKRPLPTVIGGIMRKLQISSYYSSNLSRFNIFMLYKNVSIGKTQERCALF